MTALLLPAPEVPGRPAGVLVAPHVFGGGYPGDDATARLAGLIEPEFLAGAGWDPVARSLSPRADHRLLGWAVCQVAACGNKVDAIGGTCQACRRRQGTGGSPAKADARPGCPAGAEPGACAVKGCGRVTRSMRQPLCESHRRHRGKLGLAVADFAARPGVVPLPAFGTCQVAACSRQRSGSKSPYCEQHAVRLRGQRRADAALDEQRWRLTEPAIARDGTVSLAGLRDTLAVQVLLGLQQRSRHGSKTSMTDLAQICDHGRRARAGALAELACPGAGNKAVLTRALTRFVYQALLDPEAEQAKDAWDLAAFGQNGHLDFTVISQPWLRQAAKGWAIDDLPRHRGRAGGTLQDRLKALARLSDSLRGGRGDGGNDPAALGRPDIDAFLNRLACLAGNGELSEYARARTCQTAGRVLSRIRAIGLTRPGGAAAGLPDDVTLTASDIPAHPEEPEPGRDLPPEIMRQLCGRLDMLEQRANPEFRIAAELAMDTGRRPEEICTLPWDCLERDADGAAVLVYDNRKSNRPGRRLPVGQAAARLIAGQKTRVRARYPRTPPGQLALLPSPRSNPDGHRPVSVAGLGNAHREWVDAMPPLLLADGSEFDKARVVPYAYRHSYAQRHADAGVPIDVLRELMDHASFEVTKRYYRVGEARRREAVDKVTAMQFDRHGNRIWRDAPALLDTQHARYAIGEVAVPFGTCSEPSNVQAGGKSCPLRFRCAGCDHFRTNVSYLPDLTAYLDDLLRSRERLAAAVDGADEWARAEATPSDEEITRVRRLISRISTDIAQLTPADRAAIDEAVTAVRRHRTVTLGMPAVRAPLPAIREEATA